MVRLRAGSLGLALAALLGCGGDRRSAESPALVTAPVSSAVVMTEEPPDLSPVPAPLDLVLLGRLKQPRRVVNLASKWSGMPFSIADLPNPDARALLGVVGFDTPLDVNWDAPVDVLVALDPLGEGKVPQPLAVVSVGLVSLSEAVNQVRAAGVAPRRVQPGVFRLAGDEDLACAIAAAVGQAPARLVCGERWKDVEGLLAYATRGLPTHSLGDVDLGVELYAEPIERRYGRELAAARLMLGLGLSEIELDSPRFDRALGDIAYALADEGLALLADLDRIRVDAALDANKEELVLSASLKFKGRSSWFVQTLQDSRSGPAPDELFRMPEEMDGGSFDFSAPKERWAPLGKALGALAEGYLEALNAPRAVRERARRVVERFFRLGATSWVTGVGAFPELPAKNPLRQNVYKDFGWTLAYLPEKSQEVRAFFDDIVGILEDPALRRLLKQKLDIADIALPKFKKRAVNVPRFKRQGFLYEIALSQVALERLDFLLPDRDLGASVAGYGKLVAIVVADGSGTWIGFGPDDKRLIAKFADIAADGAGRHPKIQGLKSLNAITGAFTTLAGLLRDYPFLLRDQKVEDVLAQAPARGATPIVSFGSVERASNATSLRVSLAAPRAVLTDIATLGPILAGQDYLIGPAGRIPQAPKVP